MAYGKTLAALADPTRRAVLERLVEGPRSVTDIAGHLPVSRPAVSQHFKVLKEAGLVREWRDGARRVYAADPAALGELRAYVEVISQSALDQFAAAVEASQESRDDRHRRVHRAARGEGGHGQVRTRGRVPRFRR